MMVARLQINVVAILYLPLGKIACGTENLLPGRPVSTHATLIPRAYVCISYCAYKKRE